MKRSVITINTFFLKNKKKRENSYEAFQIRMKKFQIRWNLYFANIFRFIFFFFHQIWIKNDEEKCKEYIYINSVHVPCIYMNSYFFLIKNKKKLTKNFA